MSLAHDALSPHAPPGKLDPEAFVRPIREDFPILQARIHGKPLAYLDNAASTQKPRQVIDRIADFYRNEYSNVHRGVHQLSQVATEAFEGARETVRRFLNARSTNEIIFTRGTTEAINLVAASYGRANVGPGDEIVISAMEHHSNIVPWQLLCEEKGAKLRIAPISDDGQIITKDYRALLNERTKLVAIVHVSNALGTITPVHRITQFAHELGIPVLLDGAQSVPHRPVDVEELDVDFFAFSGHKVYGPSGIGVLYGRERLLEEMPPYQGGGDMIETVAFEKSTWNRLPYKFEAGTPNIAGAVGLAAALDYVERIGLGNITNYEGSVQAYADKLLRQIDGLRPVGTNICKAAVISFVVDGTHPTDIGTLLDADGIAVRTGHHCAQPVMRRFGVPATVRASLGVYNTYEEVERLAESVRKAVKMLR